MDVRKGGGGVSYGTCATKKSTKRVHGVEKTRKGGERGKWRVPGRKREKKRKGLGPAIKEKAPSKAMLFFEDKSGLQK